MFCAFNSKPHFHSNIKLLLFSSQLTSMALTQLAKFASHFPLFNNLLIPHSFTDLLVTPFLSLLLDFVFEIIFNLLRLINISQYIE